MRKTTKKVVRITVFGMRDETVTSRKKKQRRCQTDSGEGTNNTNLTAVNGIFFENS
jgi:hypothetical protein